MFRSFFPSPKWFFLSAVAWCGLAVALWFGADFNSWQPALDWTAQFADIAEEGKRAPFLSPEKLWTYAYVLVVGAIFPFLWIANGRNGWYRWSVVGTTFIVVVSYFTTQVSVFLTEWYRKFYDLIQAALSEPGSVSAAELMTSIGTVLPILMATITVAVLMSFFTKHYLFRWRTAMSNYYMHYWPKLRTVEGAAQRVQEDTQRFSAIVESLGERLVDSVMILIAFLPLLLELSADITELPFLGQVNGSLVYLAIASALFGTVLMAAVGFKLPGLQFANQRVEAAYRKELVYGEDSEQSAKPEKIRTLYDGLIQNYFRLYFHYLYFEIFRYGYLQASNFILLIMLVPTFAAGAITFGFFQQVSSVFSRVENSFQYLANAWPTIIELLSIHKRLVAFESNIKGAAVPPREEWITDFAK